MLKNFFRSTWFYLVLIIILTLPLCLGFFGTHLINGHDAMAGLIRALSMEKYMGHGQFFVRWSPEINWGYGYPMFNFYPPFFSFLSVLFFQLTHHMVLAINLVCVLFWVLSGMGMFLFAREFWGNEGGMLSAILYVYAPYHILDLYVRGAFAEFSSFAFFPFLLLSILKMSRRADLGVFLLGAGCVFSLSLTHNIMSMLFFPVAAAFMLYVYIFENRSAWIVPAAGMFVVGLMMSSFFWLPALAEKKFLNLGFLLTRHFDYHENFISLRNLFWPFKVWSMDHISFQVGAIHSLLCLGALVGLPKIFKISRSLGRGFIFFLIVGLTAVYFTLPCSHLWWEHIRILSFMQFPWRMLAIIVFAVSFLCGSALVLIRTPVARTVFLIVAGTLVVIIYIKSVPKPVFIDPQQRIEDFLALGDGEYTPKWVMVPPDKRPDRKFQIIQGKGQLGAEKSLNPVLYVTQFRALEPSLLCFHTFYFPGWHVFIDGQPIQPYLDNPFGLILFYVPGGDHQIEVVFGTTPVRIMGTVISWVGAVLLLCLILMVKLSK